MSYALQLLIGGALFVGAYAFLGIEWVVALALALFILELAYDLRRYRSRT